MVFYLYHPLNASQMPLSHPKLCYELLERKMQLSARPFYSHITNISPSIIGQRPFFPLLRFSLKSSSPSHNASLSLA